MFSETHDLMTTAMKIYHGRCGVFRQDWGEVRRLNENREAAIRRSDRERLGFPSRGVSHAKIVGPATGAACRFAKFSKSDIYRPKTLSSRFDETDRLCCSEGTFEGDPTDIARRSEEHTSE